MSEEPEELGEQEKQGPSRRTLYQIVGIVFITAALLLALYGVVALSAWQQGRDVRADNEQSALETDLRDQLGLAREDIQKENFALALQRLEWVLSRDANYPGAEQLWAEAQSGLDLILTPSPSPTETATPKAVEVEIGPDPVETFKGLEVLLEDEEWETLVATLLEFQTTFPNYRRQESDKMLYDAYIELGNELVVGEQVELGIFYYSQAEKLGDLPLAVLDQRSWAELYLAGISYFGVNWEATVNNFRDLCAAAPFYQGSCSKLQQALTAYAGQYTAVSDWCPAEELYREAIRISSNSALSEALGLAVEGCLQATPTPTATIETEGTPEATPTPESD